MLQLVHKIYITTMLLMQALQSVNTCNWLLYVPKYK